MDELKISNRFLCGMISKLISKIVKSKTGYSVNANVKNIYATYTDDKVSVSFSGDMSMSIDEFKKVTRILNLGS